MVGLVRGVCTLILFMVLFSVLVVVGAAPAGGPVASGVSSSCRCRLNRFVRKHIRDRPHVLYLLERRTRAVLGPHASTSKGECANLNLKIGMCPCHKNTGRARNGDPSRASGCLWLSRGGGGHGAMRPKVAAAVAPSPRGLIPAAVLPSYLFPPPPGNCQPLGISTPPLPEEPLAPSSHRAQQTIQCFVRLRF